MAHASLPKRLLIFKMIYDVDMLDPVSLLQKIVRSDHILIIVITDNLKRTVFTILRLHAGKDSISNLHIRVV